jgi:hypothetical protein
MAKSKGNDTAQGTRDKLDKPSRIKKILLLTNINLLLFIIVGLIIAKTFLAKPIQ